MPAPVPRTAQEPDRTGILLGLSFACPACGQDLVCPVAPAGRKVRCPACRQVTLAPQPGPPASPAPSTGGRLLPAVILTVVLVSTFLLQLHNLGHSRLTHWDEAYHAVVARNVLKHPFLPTLVDVPYLPYDLTQWKESHVWLHKPILPFWQVALSFAVLGVNPFALRLPAALLGTAAAWLTYLIGKDLLDRRSALLAAALQAANPFLMTLVHGYQFADNVDVALLFWVEVGVYFLTRSLRNGSWGGLLLAGLAQGLAFLCKTYLAGIVLGIALAAWLLPLCGAGKREDCRIGPGRILAMLAVTLLSVAPWLVYCAWQYPELFRQEHALIWKHLGANVEGWAAPWDRVVFDYLVAMYGVFYTPILVASVVLLGKALTQRHTGLWLVYAWGLGVLLPHLLAATKTPAATLIGCPALFLLLGHFVSEALRGRRGPLAALTAVLALGVLFPAVIKNPGYGYPSSRVFGAIMRQNLWVIGHVAGALAFAAVAVVWCHGAGGSLGRWVQRGATVFCLGVLVGLGSRTVSSAWQVTCVRGDDAPSVEVGRFAREQLPENAVLLCEEGRGGEHLALMFYADRTCYALAGREPDRLARQVQRAGGIAYIVSRRGLALPAVYVSGKGGLRVYRWREAR